MLTAPDSVLKNLTEGQLQVRTSSRTYSFPAVVDKTKPHLCSELRVLNDVFWIRLCTMGDLGFSESYMFGEIECDDLISTFLVRASI